MRMSPGFIFDASACAVDSVGPAAAVGKDLKIAARLRYLHYPEGVLLARNRQIVRIVTGDLQKYAAVRTTFVCLSGGMEKTRTEAEASGDLLSVTDSESNFLQ